MDNLSNQSLRRQVIHPYSKDFIVTQEVVTNDSVNQPRGCGAWLRYAVKITFQRGQGIYPQQSSRGRLRRICRTPFLPSIRTVSLTRIARTVNRPGSFSPHRTKRNDVTFNDSPASYPRSPCRLRLQRSLCAFLVTSTES